MMKDFTQKNVFITGGSSGIGLSTAKLLAAAGANVIIFARTQARLESALKEIESRRVSSSQRFAFRQLDVTDHVLVNTVMSEAVQSFGIPDLLMNNAGRNFPHYFDEVTYAQFDDTLKTNLYSVWSTLHVLVSYMKSKGGVIVNVSSICGVLGAFGCTDYCASKFGIVGLSEALRQELRQYHIDVCVLCPPDTDTPGLATENITKPAETKALSEGTKIMHPDDIARELITGIKRGSFMIFPGADNKFTYAMKRYLPFIVDGIMNGRIRKAQQRRV